MLGKVFDEACHLGPQYCAPGRLCQPNSVLMDKPRGPGLVHG